MRNQSNRFEAAQLSKNHSWSIKPLVLAALLSVSMAHAAQVDLGFYLGEIRGSSGISVGTALRLGIFTGYTEGSSPDFTPNAGFFTGKTYDDLFSSFVPFALSDPVNQSQVTDSAGQVGDPILNFDTGSTPINRRMFAWFWNSATPSSSAKWAIISGGAATESSTYSPLWLTPAPDNSGAWEIQASTTFSRIYAASGEDIKLIPDTTYDPQGANLVIPEPSSAALFSMAMGLLFLFNSRKAQLKHKA